MSKHNSHSDLEVFIDDFELGSRGEIENSREEVE